MFGPLRIVAGRESIDVDAVGHHVETGSTHIENVAYFVGRGAADGPAGIAALQRRRIHTTSKPAQARGIGLEAVKAHGKADVADEFDRLQSIEEHREATHVQDVDLMSGEDICQKRRQIAGSGGARAANRRRALGNECVQLAGLIARQDDLMESLGGEAGDRGEQLFLQPAPLQPPDRMTDGHAPGTRISPRGRDGDALMGRRNRRALFQ